MARRIRFVITVPGATSPLTPYVSKRTMAVKRFEWPE